MVLDHFGLPGTHTSQGDLALSLEQLHLALG